MLTDNVSLIRKDLRNLSDDKKALIFSNFFKTQKGGYGYGDKFIGVTVPQARKIALQYNYLNFKEIEKILISPIHEERLVSLLILINKFDKSDVKRKAEIFNFYLKNIKYINNWDLVDLSCYKILGNFLYNLENNSEYKFAKKIIKTDPKYLLNKLSSSKNLWERRMSIVLTFYFIRNNHLEKTFYISKKLLKDEHDLIHKAVGWMLREAGKRNKRQLISFLGKYYKKMPRTMLRYSIENFSYQERKDYLKGYV